MAVKPYTPTEAAAAKPKTIPDEVIEIVNELLATNLNGRVSSFTSEELKKAIFAKGLGTNNTFPSHWLDIEPIYEKAGWKVEYDGPGYNETYKGYYTFTKKK